VQDFVKKKHKRVQTLKNSPLNSSLMRHHSRVDFETQPPFELMRRKQGHILYFNNHNRKRERKENIEYIYKFKKNVKIKYSNTGIE